jgi:hypothetical protein
LNLGGKVMNNNNTSDQKPNPTSGNSNPSPNTTGSPTPENPNQKPDTKEKMDEINQKYIQPSLKVGKKAALGTWHFIVESTPKVIAAGKAGVRKTSEIIHHFKSKSKTDNQSTNTSSTNTSKPTDTVKPSPTESQSSTKPTDDTKNKNP